MVMHKDRALARKYLKPYAVGTVCPVSDKQKNTVSSLSCPIYHVYDNHALYFQVSKLPLSTYYKYSVMEIKRLIIGLLHAVRCLKSLKS